INCTNCGPRFTIIKDIPYVRGRTTMNVFKMCKDCEAEYHDPSNRRFHAQPDVCWICGPRLKLVDNKGRQIENDDPISIAAKLLKKGDIVAIKGIGGYHLACDATQRKVVIRLRERKNRIDKPFALMMLSLQQIKEFCKVSYEEERLLLSPRRPIVLLKRKNEAFLPQEIAPKNKYLGVMLPYTPLHYLLLEETKVPLIMTSGNVSEEPIAYRDEDALNRLGKIADAFLVHNREIQIRVDDSVSRVVEGKTMIIRRSRGYAPQPLKVNVEAKKCVLATGGHLKNTFCLLKGNYGILSHHIGDLENLEALSALEEGIEHYKKIFYCQPQVIACDMHPNYTSTILAREYAKKNSLPLILVQHHHAHIVSLLAEKQINRKVIGVAFDGSGLGSDGSIWGGEFLIADQARFKRVAHLRYVHLPGGEVAIKEPWRMALSYLYEIYSDKCGHIACKILSDLVKFKKIDIVQSLIRKRINSPLTSSAGRLFDAVSSILGIREKINYEGQAAIELEMLAEDKEEKCYPFRIIEGKEEFVIDTLPLVEAIVEERREGRDVVVIATRFHWSLSQIVLRVCQLLRDRWNLNEVALSGGVFQNSLILKQVTYLLNLSGFEVLWHNLLPPNDGGISLGQAVIAYQRVKEKHEEIN
ncbi:carbamoyltransferase HypF, partial [Patescibacteria group bacterium]|nr:carbamoyltransferase HypF [Patescibacteria group bacterium]